MALPRTVALYSLLVLTANAPAAQNPVDVEDLRPGLVARHADGAAATVTQLEPIPALALQAGEAPHPRLRADGTSRWDGYINILRAGEYRFGATLRGGVRVLIDGKSVLAAEAKDAAPVRKEGTPVRLEAGPRPIQIEYTRPAGAARLELFWRTPHISEEPLSGSVLFHLPAREKDSLARASQVERGRYLVEERNCTSCHRPAGNDRLAQGLHKTQGPDLSAVGRRAKAGWIYHYLMAPQELSPGSTMPHFFGKDAAGEAYAVMRYLETLGGPVRTNEKAGSQALSEVGRRLFHSIGCAVCHPEGIPEKAGTTGDHFYSLRGESGGSATYPLPDLHAKTTPAALAEFLANPLAVRPGGRMPNMLLNKKEATALARYLSQKRPDGKEYSLPPEPAGSDWVERGRRVVAARNCAACHTIAPEGKAVEGTKAKTTFEEVKERKRFDQGCLAPESGQRGAAPWFALTRRQHDDIAAFLNEGAKGAGSPAPAYHARVTLQRFNCLACHQRDGEGGLTPALIEDLRKYEKAENAETLAPPSLNGVGHKLLTPWFRKVLTEAGRARPWMALRMPQFGAANVGHLPAGIAALEGTTTQDTIDKLPAVSAAKIEIGRQLVGKGAFGCTSCHDIAGVVTGGTRGPDLATTNQRVRYPWFRRWLESAQRMHPGTKMPTVFPEGKSLLEKVLAGNADAQSEAMWAYLAIGPTLPLPEGVEVVTRGTVLAARNRPVLLRTFMPDAGTRAVAVGYPGGLSAVFDATQCRLAYAWTGGFLDASPVWNNRGGAPATVLGTRFWTAPPGFPWSVGTDGPHFDEQSKDPAFGVPLPEGQVYQGPAKLFFDGYLLDEGGAPTFLYRVAAGKDTVRISERPEPVRGPLANGITRQFALEIPAKQGVWFFAGTSEQRPGFIDATGTKKHLPGLTKAPSGNYLETTADWVVVLPRGGGRVALLQLGENVKGLRWRAREEKNGHWSVFLHLPAGGGVQLQRIAVRVLAPHSTEPEVMQELLSRKR